MPNQKIDFGRAIAACQPGSDFARLVQQNVATWRDVNGSLELTKRHPFDFDPRADFWRLTERRMLLLFFSRYWEGCYDPATKLRSTVWTAFKTFDDARQRGAFGEPMLADSVPAKWPSLRKSMLEVARTVPDLPEYRALCHQYYPKWPEREMGVDIETFIDEEVENIDSAEKATSFKHRIPWYPYLGLRSADALRERQLATAAYFRLFTSTNSYRYGGAQVWAPILQNNASSDLMNAARRWAGGNELREPVMMYGRGDEKRDCRNYTPVTELYGQLNLHRHPFVNNAVEGVYRNYVNDLEASPDELTRKLGILGRDFLEANGDQISTLSERFTEWLRTTEAPRTLMMESDELETGSPDREHADELQEAALNVAARLSPLEKASIALHLCLDSDAYVEAGVTEVAATEARGGSEEEKTRVPKTSPAADAIAIILPETLTRFASDSLGYLRAGFHVLLAGPPGTGKTTLAQFVAHAWNHSLQSVAVRIPFEEVPTTVVANASWSTMHTVGAFLPSQAGGFAAHPGVFIRPDSIKGIDWELRDEALVLDEMNRADLDRCVGDLYPLLSGSVRRVSPAGIPGVNSVKLNDRFRLIATVNDTSIDDIVFSMSEGLSRRFVRLEIPGASLTDLKLHVGSAQEANQHRVECANTILHQFIEECRLRKLLTTFTDDDEDHLPFGAGYLGPLRSWVAKRLTLSDAFEQRPEKEQALAVLQVALRPMKRNEGLQTALQSLKAL